MRTSVWVFSGLVGCATGQIGVLSRPPAAVVAGTPTARIVLAGDAGKDIPEYLLGTPEGQCRTALDQPPCPDPLLAAISFSLAGSTDGYMVWLGDNVYPAGVPARRADEANAIIRRQAAVADPDRVRFVPGNHDWNQSTVWQSRLDHEADAIGPAKAMAYDASGVSSERIGALRVVYVDSERAIEQPRGRAKILDALRAIDPNEDVLLLSHHPMASAQKHGQHKAYDLFADTELANPKYLAWRRALGAWIHQRPGAVVLGAGHDHGLQLLDVRGVPGGPMVQIISGAGSKAAGVAPDGDLALTVERPGFVILDVIGDQLAVQEVYLRYDPLPGPPLGCDGVDGFPGWSACRPFPRRIDLTGSARWSTR